MDKYTIRNFNEDFPDDDACLGFVADLIYPDGIHCRTCGEFRPHHRLNNRKAYSCDYCGTHVYPLAGTIFEKSRTPLKSWFYSAATNPARWCRITPTIFAGGLNTFSGSYWGSIAWKNR